MIITTLAGSEFAGISPNSIFIVIYMVLESSKKQRKENFVCYRAQCQMISKNILKQKLGKRIKK